MQLSVSHLTRYIYSDPIRQVTQSMRMSPSEHAGQRVLEWHIESQGATFGSMFTDGAGNFVQTLCIRCASDIIEISVQGVVETSDTNGILRDHRERIHPVAYLQHTHATRPDKNIKKLALDAVSDVAESDPLEKVHRMAHRVADAIDYEHASTNVTTTAAQALENGRGVCQDYAHVLIAAAGVIGLPARYVSGYLFSSDSLSPYESSHAWAEVFIRDLGWVGFDPANRCCPDEKYIRLAAGLDAIFTAPIRGVSRGQSREQLDVKVAVKSMQQ
jgi:transglutaminase-like putative cysteine protease